MSEWMVYLWSVALHRESLWESEVDAFYWTTARREWEENVLSSPKTVLKVVVKVVVYFKLGQKGGRD